MTWQSLTAADSTLWRWRTAMTSWGDGSNLKFDEEIHAHFMNDLDTAKALLRLRAIEKDPAIGNQDKRAIFLYADQLLALDLDKKVKSDISDEATQLLTDRASARANGDWAESDRLRDLLATLKIEVRDSKDGQSWEVIR
jgi:cysteinyl-tRNA synthetase